MSYHYSADQDGVEAGIAELPEPDRTEANSQKEVVLTMMHGLADLYGFTNYSASVNGAAAPSWTSVNVMLTKAP